MHKQIIAVDFDGTLCENKWPEIGEPNTELIGYLIDSHLLNGGEDSVGMTDNQYKGMLLDELEDWQEVLDLAVEAGNAEIQKKAEKQIAKINEKLKF